MPIDNTMVYIVSDDVTIRCNPQQYTEAIDNINEEHFIIRNIELKTNAEIRRLDSYSDSIDGQEDELYMSLLNEDYLGSLQFYADSSLTLSPDLTTEPVIGRPRSKSFSEVSDDEVSSIIAAAAAPIADTKTRTPSPPMAIKPTVTNKPNKKYSSISTTSRTSQPVAFASSEPGNLSEPMQFAFSAYSAPCYLSEPIQEIEMQSLSLPKDLIPSTQAGILLPLSGKSARGVASKELTFSHVKVYTLATPSTSRDNTPKFRSVEFEALLPINEKSERLTGLVLG